MSEQAHWVVQWVLRVWLAFGVLAVLTLPGARSANASVGWLPFWLVAVPALMAWQSTRLVAAAPQSVMPRRLRSMRRRNSSMMRR
jgi:hypothetical protein